MRIDIQMSSCHFIVKEDERKVICIIENTKNDVLYFINKYLSWIDKDMHTKLCKMIKMPSTFVGVATCAPEDTWDEKIGRKIAYYKAKYKYVISFFKRANALIDELDKRLAKIEHHFNEYGMKMDENMSKMEAGLRDFLTFDSEN